MVIESQRIRGITDPKVLARLQAAMVAMPDEMPPMQVGHHGPKYEYHRPWYVRFMAKGCNRCGGEPPGWLQKQIQTPYRSKRMILWLVNLIPRGVSFVRVVTSRSVSSEQYAERIGSCGACPSAVIQLRVVKGSVRETSYCGQCECPKWYGSRNAVRNRLAAWRCPVRRHAGSDPYLVFAEYVREKAEAVQGNGRGGDTDGNTILE